MVAAALLHRHTLAAYNNLYINSRSIVAITLNVHVDKDMNYMSMSSFLEVVSNIVITYSGAM